MVAPGPLSNSERCVHYLSDGVRRCKGGEASGAARPRDGAVHVPGETPVVTDPYPNGRSRATLY